jgi:hypothetical protein
MPLPSTLPLTLPWTLRWCLPRRLFGRTPGQIEEHALEIGRNFGEFGHGDAVADQRSDDVGGERRPRIGRNFDQVVKTK